MKNIISAGILSLFAAFSTTQIVASTATVSLVAVELLTQEVMAASTMSKKRCHERGGKVVNYQCMKNGKNITLSKKKRKSYDWHKAKCGKGKYWHNGKKKCLQKGK